MKRIIYSLFMKLFIRKARKNKCINNVIKYCLSVNCFECKIKVIGICPRRNICVAFNHEYNDIGSKDIQNIINDYLSIKVIMF